MLFFQCALLLGYLFAHVLVQRLGPGPARHPSPARRGRPASGAGRPVAGLETARARRPHHPHPRAAGRLDRSAVPRPVGHEPAAPGLVRPPLRSRPALSPVRPLQSGLAARPAGLPVPGRAKPHAGEQARAWSAGYALFVALTAGAAAVGLPRTGSGTIPAADRPFPGPPPTTADRTMWLASSACGVCCSCRSPTT